MECSLKYFESHVCHFLGCWLGLMIIDHILKRINLQARWYIMHFLANTIVCIYAYNDMVSILRNPFEVTFNSSLVPANMTMALHLYHMIMFKNLQAIDWLHHLVMCFVLLWTYPCPHPMMTNYSLFFVNGLPGGLDYLLLTLVKNGQITKMTEKRINSSLNIWIRSPGILIGVYILFLQWQYRVVTYHGAILIIITGGLYWNAQYFTERVVYNYGVSHTRLIKSS